ncbi:MAG: prepilin peptidase [Clostridium sp.]
METIYGVLVFLIGLILGSFFNVCIYRIPRGESVSFPPSHCSVCNENIKAYDLIPIISYIILRGRCRKCRDKISMQYPIIEFITGVSFLILYLNFGFTVKFFLGALLTTVLIITAVIDINTGYIYEFISVVGIIGGIIYVIYSYATNGDWVGLIIGAIIAAAVIGLFAIFGGMGWGDVEISFMCGLYLGVSSSILMLVLSIVFGGVGGAVLLLNTKKIEKGATMAFGPYIALGGFISLVYGEVIIKGFLSYYGL